MGCRLNTCCFTFLIGGLSVSVITYFGTQGKSQLAAFVAFLPSTSLITLCTIYLNSGTQPAVSYARSMLILAAAVGGLCGRPDNPPAAHRPASHYYRQRGALPCCWRFLL